MKVTLPKPLLGGLLLIFSLQYHCLARLFGVYKECTISRALPLYTLTDIRTVTYEKPPKKLPDQMHDALKTKHYSVHTESSYVDWMRGFILFH